MSDLEIMDSQTLVMCLRMAAMLPCDPRHRSTLEQAASRITALEEENKRLREALKPLSDELLRWDQHPDGWTIPGTCIMVCHLRRARKEINK